MKAFPQFVLFVSVFFSTWFLLNRVDFMDAFDIEEFSRENERKLGDLIVETITSGHPELEADSVRGMTSEILSRLCSANDIADTTIRLTIISNGDVNAFALPDRRLVVHSGLIAYCKTPEELAGVIGHELAHIEHRDVMQKLVKEVGLSMLMTIAGGGSGGEILKQTARTLSSTAFDREQESEADTAAVRYMAAAGIDPEHLANFLYRLSQEKRDVPKSLAWLSTHPNSSDRAAEIVKLKSAARFTVEPIADSLAWASYRRIVKGAADD
ncbi:MAG TPA: M48 family metallopeptidase [Bacteroidota bacterium]|nr:M48 family metallopeptidase [Bacteroidota bacterium]